MSNAEIDSNQVSQNNSVQRAQIGKQPRGSPSRDVSGKQTIGDSSSVIGVAHEGRTANNSEARILELVLQSIVKGIAGRADVALSRIWLIGPGDSCAICHMQGLCPDQMRCLHLVASSGNAIDREHSLHLGGNDWTDIDGHFHRIPLDGSTKIGEVAVTGSSVRIEIGEGTEKPGWIAQPEWAREQQINSFAACPLSLKGDVFGVLGMFSRARLTDQEFNWFRSLADLAIVAIANTRTLEERLHADKAPTESDPWFREFCKESPSPIEDSKQAVGKNKTLLEISNALVTNLSQDTLLRAVSQALHNIIEFDGAALALYLPEKDAFRLLDVESRLRSKDFRPGVELDRKANSAGWVFENRKPLVRRNLFDEQNYENERILAGEGVRSQIIVPLIARGQCIGALTIASRTPSLYTEADADFLHDVANQVALAVENMRSYEEISALKMRLEKENIYLKEEISKEHNFVEIVGNSRPLMELLHKVELIAPADSSVLIWGETGTGKELIARAIHAHSSRRDAPLVKVNCGSIPAGLVESELFGHIKGAFTGATANRVGRFELADGGTLFLDEVGELPLDTQVKLLRVLQEQEFEPVGSSRTIRVDVRIVAATNRDLEQAVKVGSFRSDLYYRLNVLPLRVPSLRERREDIPQLALFFLERYCKRTGKTIDSVSKSTMDLLINYSWPGNIRELQNVIERGVVLCRGSVLSLDPELFPVRDIDPITHFAASGNVVDMVQSAIAKSVSSSQTSLEEVERRHILDVLQQTRGQISGPNGAATVLKLNASTLRSRIKKLGIIYTRRDISQS